MLTAKGLSGNLGLLAIDAVLVGAAYGASVVLRFAFDVPPAAVRAFVVTLPGVLALKLVVFVLFRLYKVIWRHIGMIDLFNTVKANAVSSLALALGGLLLGQAPKEVVTAGAIDGLLSLFLVAGVRVAIRLTTLSIDKRRESDTVQSPGTRTRKVVIVGAGEVGEKIFREIRDSGRLRYEVVGFLDDDPRKIGLSIHGKSVLGNVDDLGKLARTARLDEVIIAIGAASGKQMRRIVEICERHGLSSRTVPVVGDILNGQVSVNRVRPVSYEDLLGRPTLALDRELIGAFLRGKTVLVTGGGVSIGSALCRQVSSFDSRRLLICDNSENNLYEIDLELRQVFPAVSVEVVLADVRNRSQMKDVFRTYQPAVVIHAAAYKHVPMMELHPWEAVKNNVAAALNMLTLTQEAKSEHFVLVSTDKAVRPSNVMGATKRVAELLTLAFAAKPGPPRLMIVRFGNVAGSDGSVIPLFQRQIERGGPVTVTHPDITRYFMTVSEAAQLILQAGAMGEGGEIFVLDMGRPIRIVDMARDLIRLSGLKPDEDIEIKFIGLRLGEKLYEELVADGEGIHPTGHQKIMAIRGPARRLEWLGSRIDELLACAEGRDADGIRRELQEIVPEYTAYFPRESETSQAG